MKAGCVGDEDNGGPIAVQLSSIAKAQDGSVEFLPLLAKAIVTGPIKNMKLGIGRRRTKSLEQTMPQMERRPTVIEAPNDKGRNRQFAL